MLPHFLVPTTLNDQPKVMVAQDLPVWSFFWGADPTRFKRAWLDGLLTRAIVQPALTPELVARLGDGRDETVLAYLLAVGYLEPDEIGDLAGRGWRIGRAAEVGSLTVADMPREMLDAEPAARFSVGVPLDALRGPEHLEIARLIAQVAERTHLPPHHVWGTWMISDFYLTLRILQAVASPTSPWGLS